MKLAFNPFTGQLDWVLNIPQYDTDPASPGANDAWVLRTGGVSDGVAGTPRGLLLALTYAGTTGSTYEFAYRTEQDTTIKVSMS